VVDLALDRLARLRFRLRTRDAQETLAAFKRYLLTDRAGLVCSADLAEQGIHCGFGPVEKAADLIINRRCEL
jgi:hypothetical protein